MKINRFLIIYLCILCIINKNVVINYYYNIIQLYSLLILSSYLSDKYAYSAKEFTLALECKNA